ncbi:MAG: hypothetical protein HQK77_02890 [Desulfobacterales bacterium]|nr:hypothetical protein [Desulfobacterales bacterium]
MTNYDQLFQEEMRNPKFATAYYDSRLERIITEMVDSLKEKIKQILESGESRFRQLQITKLKHY